MQIMIGQIRQIDEETALFARQLGIESVQLNTPLLESPDEYWAFEALEALKGSCGHYGLDLHALENVPNEWMQDIKTGGPMRDDQLRRYRQTIENMGKAGVAILGHNFNPTGVFRTDVRRRGRGGARVSAFDLAEADTGNVAAGAQGYIPGSERLSIDEEALWENYAHFLREVLPCAEAHGVRLALHPDDPPVPVIGGAAHPFYSVAGLERALEIANGSPAFGFDLCLGTVSEMTGGATAVRDAITRFGPAGAICYVHFRQVKGTVPSFEECFLGEGNYSAREVIQLLAASGFDGFLLDDHVPEVVGDTEWGHRARAHAIGYMQGLLASL